MELNIYKLFEVEFGDSKRPVYYISDKLCIKCPTGDIQLTSSEGIALNLLLSKPHQSFTKSELLDSMGRTDSGYQAVYSVMTRLRKKFKQTGYVFAEDVIKTLPNLGYELTISPIKVEPQETQNILANAIEDKTEYILASGSMGITQPNKNKHLIVAAAILLCALLLWLSNAYTDSSSEKSLTHLDRMTSLPGNESSISISNNQLMGFLHRQPDNTQHIHLKKPGQLNSTVLSNTDDAAYFTLSNSGKYIVYNEYIPSTKDCNIRLITLNQDISVKSNEVLFECVGNIVGYNHIAWINEREFYYTDVHSETPTKYGQRIYRYDIEGRKSTLFSKVNIPKPGYYQLNFDRDEQTLYALSGSNFSTSDVVVFNSNGSLKLLLQSEFPLKGFSVKDGSIWTLEDNLLKRSPAHGPFDTMTGGDSWSLPVQKPLSALYYNNGRFYFNLGSYFSRVPYSYNLNSRTLQSISTLTDTFHYYVKTEADWIFTSNVSGSYQLYRTNGKETIKLSDFKENYPFDYFVVQKDKVAILINGDAHFYQLDNETLTKRFVVKNAHLPNFSSDAKSVLVTQLIDGSFSTVEYETRLWSRTGKRIPGIYAIYHDSGLVYSDGHQLYYQEKNGNPKKLYASELTLNAPPHRIISTNEGFVAYSTFDYQNISLINTRTNTSEKIEVPQNTSISSYYDGLFYLTTLIPGNVDVFSVPAPD